MARVLDSGAAGWRRILIGEAAGAATTLAEDDIGPHLEPIHHRQRELPIEPTLRRSPDRMRPRARHSTKPTRHALGSV